MSKDNLSDEEHLINQAVGKERAEQLQAEKKRRDEQNAPRRERELAVIVTSQEIAALKALGYSVKSTAYGWQPSLIGHPEFNIRGWTLTENGSWSLCQENYSYRQRDKLWLLKGKANE